VSADVGFPVSCCARCGRDVLTHVDFDDDVARRRCVHCDAEIDPAEVRWVDEGALEPLGYGFHADDEGGCGRPGCGRGSCANRR
jgi:hypothetical protein